MRLHAYTASGTAHQETRLMLTPHDDVDTAFGSGEFVASSHYVEVEQ